MKPKFLFRTASAVLLVLAAASSLAATKTWDGGGVDNNWATAANWDADTAPAQGDALVFAGTLRVNNTNNFASGSLFSGITFSNNAGGFILNGNAISLNGNIN